MNKIQEKNTFRQREFSPLDGRCRETVFARMLFWCGLLFLFLYVFPHLEFLQHANEMPRLFMTESLVREGDMGVDSQLREYNYNKQMDLSRSFCLSNRILGAARRSMIRSGLGNPRLSGKCEEMTHPNKAPAQSFLGVPFYMLSMSWASLTGAPHSLDVKLWWLRLGTSLIPLFLLLFMMERLLRRWIPEPHPGRVALAAYGVGSMAMVYGMQLMSHSLAAFFLFGAFYFLCPAPGDSADSDTAPSFYRLVPAGFFAGAAIASDYQAGFGAAILAIYGVYRVGFNIRLVWGILGGAVPLFLLGFYHYHAYGSPFWTGYRFLIAVDDHALHARGFMGIVGPQKGPFWAVLFSAREGLVFLSPWTLFVVLGLYRMLSPRREAGDAACSDANLSTNNNDTKWNLNLCLWKLTGSLLAVGAGITAVYRSAGSGAAPWTAAFLTVLGWCLAIWALFGMVCAALFPVKSSEKASGFADIALGCVIVACGLTAPVLVGLNRGGVWTLTLPLIAACWSFISGKGEAAVNNIHRKGRAVLAVPGFFALAGIVLMSGPVTSGYLLSAFRISLWASAAAWVLLGKTRVTVTDGSEKTIGVPESLVIFAMVSFYIWFVSSVTFWHGGWQVGPRYVAVMLPFLTIGAAVAFRDCWRWGPAWIPVIAAASVSIVIYTLTAAVFPHFPKSFINPFYDLVGYLLSRGYVARNAGEYLFQWQGIHSLWPYFAATGALLLFLAVGSGVLFGKRTLRSGSGFEAERGRRWIYGILGLAAAVFVLEGYRGLPRADFQKCCGWITRMWDAESALREPAALQKNDRFPPPVRSAEKPDHQEVRPARFRPTNSSHRNALR